MKKYIDVERLKAEIERRIDLICTTEGVVQRDRLQEYETLRDVEDFIDSLQQDQPELDLEKFTEKMDDWKARFNRPDDIPIKATMAFTARMFYMYPKAAREWYESLPKATMDNTRKEETK